MGGFLTLLLLILVIGGTIIALYNSLVGKKNQVDNAFATIDVMLKKRCDLIPNLVAVAQQYMKSEQKTLTKIAGLRSRALSAQGNTRIDIENQLSRDLGNIMVAVEAYPDLKANQNFLQLQQSLNEIEEQISAARRFYNTSVTDYNNAIEMIPTNILASNMGYRRRDLFEAAEQERQNVDVQSLFNR